MKKILFIAVSAALFMLVSCTKNDSAPTSLTNTTWKYSATGNNQVIKFSTSKAGSYTINGVSTAFTYIYTDPNITITESNGEKLDGDFSSTSTLEIVQANSPTAALKFTKQ